MTCSSPPPFPPTGSANFHGVAVIAIVHFVRHECLLGRAGIRFWRDVIIVFGAALLALMAHLIEIAIWALVFALCREFTHLAPAVYHSAVNYTSLGYGDVVMSARWRLLGPLETADGMLLFGARIPLPKAPPTSPSLLGPTITKMTSNSSSK